MARSTATNGTLRNGKPTGHSRDCLAQRASAIRCQWSARERSKRATVARHLQSLLLASIAHAVHDSKVLA